MMIHTMNSTAVHCSLLSSVDAAAGGGGGAAGPDDGLAAVTGDSYICTPALYPPVRISAALLFCGFVVSVFTCWGVLIGFRARMVLHVCFTCSVEGGGAIVT